MKKIISKVLFVLLSLLIISPSIADNVFAGGHNNTTVTGVNIGRHYFYGPDYGIEDNWGHYYPKSVSVSNLNGATKSINSEAYCVIPEAAGYQGSVGVNEQYGPYDEFPDTWNELPEKVQAAFKSRDGKDINGNNVHRLGLINRWITYYAPGGPGWTKEHKYTVTKTDSEGNTTTETKTTTPGYQLSIFDGTKGISKYDYAVGHWLGTIWMADYLDGDDTSCCTMADVQELCDGKFPANVYSSTGTAVYNFYKSTFYDKTKNGTFNVDYDKLYDEVPNSYVGILVRTDSKTYQDFILGLDIENQDIDIQVAKLSSSLKINNSDLDGYTEIIEGDDVTTVQEMQIKIQKFLDQNTLYKLAGTQLQLTGSIVKDTGVKIINNDEDDLQWSTTRDQLKSESGTVTLKEKKASKGYKLNTQAITRDVKPGNSYKLTMYNDPISIPLGIKLYKNDYYTDQQSIDKDVFDFSGAEFEITYHETYDEPTTRNAKFKFTATSNQKGEIILNRENITITSGEDYAAFFVTKEGLPLGTYTIKETKAPKGFELNDNPQIIMFKDAGDYESATRHIDIYATPVKEDNQLEYDKLKKITTVSADSNAATFTQIFNRVDQDAGIYVDEPDYYGFKISKRDNDTFYKTPQGTVTNWGEASFEVVFKGIPYDSRYDTQGNRTRVHKINNGDVVYKGKANSEGIFEVPAILEAGKNNEVLQYEVREVSSNKIGYDADPREALFTIGYSQNDFANKVISNGQIVDFTDETKAAEQLVWRNGVKLKKVDNELYRDGYAQGDATLEGAEFTIWNISHNEVMVRNVGNLSSGSKGNWNYAAGRNESALEVKPVTLEEAKAGSENGRIGYITTDADGIAQCFDNDLPFGEYFIKETKPSNGYKLDTIWSARIKCAEDGYYIAEGDGSYVKVSDPVKGYMFDLTEYRVEEPVIRGGVKLQKWDKELDKSEALGGKDHDAVNGSAHDGSDLNNIIFSIKNISNHSVVTPINIDASVKGSSAPTDIDYSIIKGKYTDSRLQEVESGGIVGTITTNWSNADNAYVAYTQIDALPYGTYEIWESRNNKYYELTDEHVATVQIREDGTVYEVDKNGEALVWKDYVWRQGVEFTKIGDSTSERFSYVPFKITNVTTGEYHYVVADKNGYVNTEKTKHSQNTNGYDKFMDEAIAADKLVTEQEMKAFRLSEDGVEVTTPGYWFYLGEDGSEAPVDDTKATLPYGKYIVEEIKCEKNKDYTMAKFDFSVNQDEDKTYDTKYPPVNLDTITNDEIKIKTTATAKENGTHMAPLGEKTIIIDEVEYSGLIAHKDYTIKGQLMKKVENEDGTVSSTPLIINGEGVFANKDFTAEAGGSGKVKLEFEVDSRELAGATTVVFEDLYQESIKLATHADINDKEQTIYFPEIKTTATDSVNGTHFLTISENSKIVDKVEYKNILEGMRYNLEGRLMQVAEDGTVTPVKDKNGKEIVNSKSFVPSSMNGFEEIDFEFDATKLTGIKTVVYETLTYNGATIVTHEDPTDEGQTIYIPEIGTTAKDNNTGEHISLADDNTIIVDTINYKGIKPAENYVAKGVLMDKNTQKEVGEVVSQPFTAESINGSVEVKFEINTSKLAGKSLVVFEELYWVGNNTEPKDELKIAEHKDINDKGQTIQIPKIGTKAVTNKDKKELEPIKNGVIVDTIKYENLIPNKEYTAKGQLYDKTTGKLTNIVASGTFTPKKANGTTKVTFKFDSRKYSGHSLVVYEEVLLNGKPVAEHKNPNDKDQTIDVLLELVVTIAKADFDKVNYYLKGAEITIFDEKGNIVKDKDGKECVGVTDENGKVKFSVLYGKNSKYYAQETKAPKGYQINKDKFEVKPAENAEYQTKIDIKILDKAIIIPPNKVGTGDNTKVVLWLGVFVLVGGLLAVLGIKKVKSKK